MKRRLRGGDGLSRTTRYLPRIPNPSLEPLESRILLAAPPGSSGTIQLLITDYTGQDITSFRYATSASRAANDLQARQNPADPFFFSPPNQWTPAFSPHAFTSVPGDFRVHLFNGDQLISQANYSQTKTVTVAPGTYRVLATATFQVEDDQNPDIIDTGQPASAAVPPPAMPETVDPAKGRFEYYKIEPDSSGPTLKYRFYRRYSYLFIAQTRTSVAPGQQDTVLLNFPASPAGIQSFANPVFQGPPWNYPAQPPATVTNSFANQLVKDGAIKPIFGGTFDEAFAAALGNSLLAPDAANVIVYGLDQRDISDAITNMTNAAGLSLANRAVIASTFTAAATSAGVPITPALGLANDVNVATWPQNASAAMHGAIAADLAFQPELAARRVLLFNKGANLHNARLAFLANSTPPQHIQTGQVAIFDNVPDAILNNLNNPSTPAILQADAGPVRGLNIALRDIPAANLPEFLPFLNKTYPATLTDGERFYSFFIPGRPIAGSTITFHSPNLASLDVQLLDSALSPVVAPTQPDANTLAFDVTSRDRGLHFIHILKSPSSAPVDHNLRLAVGSRAHNADIVEVIDRSDSMALDGKFDAVKVAANLFANLTSPGDRLGVVTYASRGFLDYPLTDVTSASIADLKNIINNLTTIASTTSIGAGIFRADEQFDRFPDDLTRAMIVMTDGQENGEPLAIDVINSRVDPNIRIFTIGFGRDADENLLTRIANLRNGQYFYAADQADLQRIYTALVSLTGAQQQILNQTTTLFPGVPKEHLVFVDPSALRLNIGLNHSASKIDLELIAPDGSVINHSNLANHPNIQLTEGPTYEFYKIDLPLSGQWTVRVLPIDVPPAGATYNLYALTDSSVVARATADQASYSMGNPIRLQVALDDGAPIRDAAVTASIAYPSTGPATPSQITLFDDGAHADGAANDGVYGTLFPRTAWPGVYNVLFNVHGASNAGITFDRFPTLAITVNPGQENRRPSFTIAGNLNINENSPRQTIPAYATNIRPGPPDEGWQTVQFLVTNDNPALFAVQPAISPDGTLTYTLAHATQGAANVSAQTQDDAGTANGGIDFSFTQVFTITAKPANDPPSFTIGPDQTLNEDDPPQTIPAWATNIAPGPADESTQAVAFLPSTDNPTLFSVQPSISPNGSLTYTLAPNANGHATVTVRAQDTGGTIDGGADISAPQTFTISVNPVNDPPSFSIPRPHTVEPNSPPQIVNAFLANISPGPPDESAQTVAFLLSTDKPALFSVQPAIAPDGTLSYTPAPDARGVATITVRAIDSAGGESSATSIISLGSLGDAYEENDTKPATNARPEGARNSPNLGLLRKRGTIKRLNTLDDGSDYYRFRTATTGARANYFMITFNHAEANLNLYLLPARGRIWDPSRGRYMKHLASTTRVNREAISLAGLRPGTYYLLVYAAKNAASPNYTLTIAPPSAPATPAVRRPAAASVSSTPTLVAAPPSPTTPRDLWPTVSSSSQWISPDDQTLRLVLGPQGSTINW